MQFERFHSAVEFRDQVLNVLMADEARHNLMIGIVEGLAGSEGRGRATPDDVLLSCVKHGPDVLAACIMTPPHNAVLACVSEAAIPRLVEGIHQAGYRPPGLLGPKAQAGLFVDHWHRLTNQETALTKLMGAYQLTRVLPVSGVSGSARLATQDDLELMVDWFAGFCADTGMIASQTNDIAQRIMRGDVWLWTDPDPVAMASSGGTTPNGKRVGGVYTPPDKRCHGYASALVTELSRRILDSGKRFCFLFTDLANPTSNSIYSKIGYEQVCDFAEYSFGSGMHRRTG